MDCSEEGPAYAVCGERYPIRTRWSPACPGATTAEITKICEETPGLDPSVAGDRDRALLIHEQRHVSDWTRRQMLLMDQVQPEGSLLFNTSV
ncbi:hypothetical protein IMZ48_16385 [Candidatus Bathyarchaeota archaeon]|nr:hypothetical protein [Candidatus Bathyarchaeota archaeon]